MSEEDQYDGSLPKHVLAQIQEHTAGGYILFRIGARGETITDLEFDDEVSYLALVKKATTTLAALNKIDDIKEVQMLSMGMNNLGGEDHDDDEDSDDDDEEDDIETI